MFGVCGGERLYLISDILDKLPLILDKKSKLKEAEKLVTTPPNFKGVNKATPRNRNNGQFSDKFTDVTKLCVGAMKATLPSVGNETLLDIIVYNATMFYSQLRKFYPDLPVNLEICNLIPNSVESIKSCVRYASDLQLAEVAHLVQRAGGNVSGHLDAGHSNNKNYMVFLMSFHDYLSKKTKYKCVGNVITGLTGEDAAIAVDHLVQRLQRMINCIYGDKAVTIKIWTITSDGAADMIYTMPRKLRKLGYDFEFVRCSLHFLLIVLQNSYSAALGNAHRPNMEICGVLALLKGISYLFNDLLCNSQWKQYTRDFFDC